MVCGVLKICVILFLVRVLIGLMVVFCVMLVCKLRRLIFLVCCGCCRVGVLICFCWVVMRFMLFCGVSVNRCWMCRLMVMLGFFIFIFGCFL